MFWSEGPTNAVNCYVIITNTIFQKTVIGFRSEILVGVLYVMCMSALISR